MGLNPQQQKFKEAYIDPGSPTFGNAYRSALAAGYEEKEAKNLERIYRIEELKSKKVYFLFCPTTNKIKIGSSSNPLTRMKQISSISSAGNRYKPLFHLKYLEDGETYFHKLFSSYRENGEWFKREGEFSDFIQMILEKTHPVLIEDSYKKSVVYY